MSEALPIIQIYSQLIPHDEAYLVGTREGLKKLRGILGAAIESGRSTTELMVGSDGEGFYPIVIPLDPNQLEGVISPYRDDMYQEVNKSLEHIIPKILSKAEYRALVEGGGKVAEALAFATAAHEGQVDKQGRPYIEHPIAVAAQVSSPLEKCLALLHDVVEDCGIPLEELAQKFGASVAAGVDCLSRRSWESYSEFVVRVARGGPEVRRVKRADIRHNLEVDRLLVENHEDLLRIRKYKKVYDWLGEIEESGIVPEEGPGDLKLRFED